MTVSLGVAYLLRAKVLDSRHVPTDSMEPTFNVGDSFLHDKLRLPAALRNLRREPSAERRVERGDVVTCRPPARLRDALADVEIRGDTCVIKRVVAISGDVVRVRRGRLYINGELLSEEYVAEPMRYSLRSTTVPEAHVFVLGDNRNRSLDSHVWGALPCDHLLGRPLCTYWPPARMCGSAAYAHGRSHVRDPFALRRGLRAVSVWAQSKRVHLKHGLVTMS